MKRLAALAAAWLAIASTATYAQPSSVFMESLTSPELREAVRAGKTTILVPIGGTEQNGPHMVLGKHNVRAHEMAGRIAEGLGNALVAPVIAYVPEGAIDPPTGHMKYPGTISIPVDAFEKTLEGAARSFRHAGFRDVVFLGDHGGYRASLDRIAAKLNREWKGTARVHPLPEYYRELPHAGRDDTSLAMGLQHGQLVREDRLTASTTSEGAAQDPSGASADLGTKLLRDSVERSVAAIRRSTAHPPVRMSTQPGESTIPRGSQGRDGASTP